MLKASKGVPAHELETANLALLDSLEIVMFSDTVAG